MNDAAAPAAVALVGDPVADSVSPAIHSAAFRATGLELDYLAVRVAREQLVEAWPGLSARFIGLNVTRPLKEAILPLLDVLAPQAAEAGSVNTVVFRQGAAEGHSTDGEGFLGALRRARTRVARVATILGTGGAARAVTHVLRREGTSVFVSGRNGDAGRRLSNAFAATFVPLERGALAMALTQSDLLVNCTPLGARPNSLSSPLPPGVPLHRDLLVFDLVYRPRRTRLLAQARAGECHTIEGIEMLIEQAGRSFQLWTGIAAPLEVMRDAAYHALDATTERQRVEGGAQCAS